MTKDEIKKQLCELLNISSSYKEKVFSKLLEKITAKLNNNDAIKIYQLGLFTLREEPLTREERAKKKTGLNVTKRVLFFLPQHKTDLSDSESFYFTFDLSDLGKISSNFSEEIFSLSINAPLIPVDKNNVSEITADKENEVLEDKLDDLINKSDIINDYDFWNEVTDFAGKPEEEFIDEGESELRDLVSQSLLKENSTIDEEEATEQIYDDYVKDEENQFDEINSTELDDNINDNDINNSSTEQENEDDEKDLIKDDEISSSDSVSWNWGDELKKEFDEEEIINSNDSLVEDPEYSPHEKAEKKEYEDPFEEVEKTISDIEDDAETNVPPNVEKSDLISDEKPKDSEDQTSAKKPLERKIEDYQPEVYKPNRFSIGPIFWILLSVIIFLGFFLVYFFYTDEDNNGKAEEVQRYPGRKATIEQGGEITTQGNLSDDTEFYQSGIDSLEEFGEIYNPQEQNNNSKVQTETSTPVVQQQSSTGNLQLGELYRTIPNENQLSNLVFYDGAKYNVQVASHKNRDGAEAQAKKLRNMGYDAFIVETYLAALKGTWYRVRVGFFNSKEEAEKFRRENNSIIN